MRPRTIAIVALAVLAATALWAQRGRRYFDDIYDPRPPDALEKTEFAFARLQYPGYGRGGFGGGFGGRRRGGGGSWATDWPKADRQFLMGVRRLTRMHSRSEPEVVDLTSDEIMNWPWIYAVEVGRWDLPEDQAAKLREYLLKGGFLMVDDFHGTYQWESFAISLSRVFPDRPVVEIEDKDQVFHVLYDLDERFQVPGIQYFGSGRTYEQDGVEARWRGIYDDNHRLMVAICFNMDIGDAWEWADLPEYPEAWASLAYRIGINYIVYAMTR